jgi:hypothetical protein
MTDSTNEKTTTPPLHPYCKKHPDSFNGFCDECLIVRVEMRLIARRLSQKRPYARTNQTKN